MDKLLQIFRLLFLNFCLWKVKIVFSLVDKNAFSFFKSVHLIFKWINLKKNISK